MTFPTIPTAAAGRLLSNVQANTNGSRVTPSLTDLTKNSGDLLLAVCISYGAASYTGPGGWNIISYHVGNVVSMTAYYKWSTGSETGTLTITENTPTGHAAMFLMSIPGAHASTPPEEGGWAFDTGAAADPASFNPNAWDAEDTLWIALGGCGETGTGGAFTGVSAAPTNYTGYAETGISGDVVGGVEGAVGFRQLNASAEDVGTFTVDISNARNSAWVLAVRPGGVTNYNGQASRALSLGITATGRADHSTGASVPLALGITASGSVGGGNFTGTSSVPLTETITAAGAVGKQTGASVPLSLAITATGSVSTGRVAPTRVAYSEVATWHTDTTPRSTGSVSWQTGDEIYVLGMTASSGATLGTPTATGLTFNPVGTNPTGGSSACNGYAWKAVAASNGSGAISGSRTADFGEWGIAVWVMRGTDGTGTKATNVSTAKTVSTTRTADKSRVIEIIGDWSAGAVTGYSWTPAGATDDEASNGDGTQYGIYVADWPDQGAAGTTSYGITGTSSTGQHTKIAIEVKGTGSTGAYTGTASRPLTETITATGKVGKQTGANLPLALTTTPTGKVGKVAGAAVALGLAITATGVVGTASGASVPLTETITASGTVGKQTGASVGLAFGITATGQVEAAGLNGSATLPLTETITATGAVGTVAGASVPLSFDVTAAGLVARSSPASVPLALTITAAGVVGTSSAASVPLSLGITASGSVQAAVSPVQRIAVTASATNQPTITAFSPTLPTHISGDRLTLVVTGKYNTAAVPTIDQGWTTVENGTGGTGTTGADVGPTFWVVYQKDATSSSETAPTVTPVATLPNSWEWFCVSHRPGTGMQWADTIASGGVGYVVSASDTTTGSPLTGTTDAFNPQVVTGDAIFAVGVIPTDLGTALGTTTVTETGLSGGTVDATSTNYTENNTGADTAAVWAGWTGFEGTGSAGLALSFTITGATNQSGSLVGIAFRQEAAAYTGTASLPLALGITATGRADHSAGTSRPLTETITAAGVVGKRAESSVGMTEAITASGVVGKQTAASVPLALTITATGSVTAGLSSSAVRDETLTITATGTVAHSAGASRALTLAITSGGLLGKTSGANRPLTLGITTAGAVGRSTGTSRPLTLTVLATGTKAAYAGANLPLALTITATGQVSTSLTGSATLGLALTITATGSVYVVPPGTAVQGGKVTLLNYAGTVYLTGSGKATILEE